MGAMPGMMPGAIPEEEASLLGAMSLMIIPALIASLLNNFSVRSPPNRLGFS